MEDFSEFARAVVAKASVVNGHGSKDWEILAATKAVTIPWAVPIAKACIEMLYGHPATAETMAKYGRSDRELGLAVWLERMLSGVPGASFWPEACLLGYVHAMVGADTGVLVAMGTKIQEQFSKSASAAFPAQKAAETSQAFNRTFEVAMAVILASYEQAVMNGMTQLGFNPRLLTRMRTVAIKKMVDEGRGSLPLMDWSDALSVSNDEIDNQHKILIGLLNALHGSTMSGKGNDTLRKVLADLLSYTANHFAYEEKLFDKYNYPELGGHKEAHKKLAAQVIHFNDEFQAGRGRLSAELFMFLRSWLNGHIRGSDKAFGKFLISKGIK